MCDQNSSAERLTQEICNQMHKEAKGEWDRMLADSGKSPALLIATSNEAVQLLAMYHDIQTEARKQGFSMQDLVDGLKINVAEDNPKG